MCSADHQCADHQKYLFKLRDTLEVQVLAVRPSRCRVTKLYVTRSATVLHTQSVQAVPEVELVAGHAYYVGLQVVRFEDAAAITKAEAAEWVRRLGPPNESYERATAELRRAFPNLASLSTENGDL